jgi:hypothetical protein
MGIGAPVFGFHHPIKSNAVVDVESAVPATAGGTQYTWSAYASAVDVLLTQVSGSQDLDGGVNAQTVAYTVSGVHPSLYRSGIRLKVVTHADNPDLVGRYLRPLSVSRHPASPGGLVVARITLGCGVMLVPGDDGAE